MSLEQTSPRMARLMGTVSPFLNFYTTSDWNRRRDEPGVADFVLGNPQEMPLPGVVAAMKKWSEPQHKDWFAYKDYIPTAQNKIAATLHAHCGVAFHPEDILMTTGAFAGLSTSIATVTEPGDEVIFISPPWFFYEGMILQHGAVPVRVRIDLQTMGPDLAAIRAAITEKTRAIIVNSPNNPTGRIYTPEELTALAAVLTEASERNGRPIYIISDEAYSRILMDGRSFPSPTRYYPNTLLIYTYGKTLLMPGARIGYIALPPDMPDREAMRQAIYTGQIFESYGFPNALLQYAIEDIESLSIDIEHIQEKRDRMVPALRGMGYAVNMPEGTFYLLLKSPLEDDLAFIDLLAAEDVFCLPGSVFEMPGYFRISLTANDEMVEIGLPGLARAIARTGMGE